MEIMPSLLKLFATPLIGFGPPPTLDEENLVIGFGPPPHFRNASAIAESDDVSRPRLMLVNGVDELPGSITAQVLVHSKT